MRIIVTGSRDWSDGPAVWTALDEASRAVSPADVTIVHGGCPTGADFYAEHWANAHDVAQARFWALWNLEGKAAGPRRNQRMVEAGADLVLAFPLPEGRGTQDCMIRAERAGIPVKNLGEL